MISQELFILSDNALNAVIAQIKDEQWSLAIPKWFQVGGQNNDNLTLRTIINYHAYDDAWVPTVLSGLPLADATDVPSDMNEDLLGDDPKAAYSNLVNDAVAAVRALDDPKKIVHLSYGEYPAEEYLQHVSSFRGFRTYDIAKLIGIDTTMPAELVTGLWEVLSPHFAEWRAMGVFKDALPIPDGATMQQKLLLSVGRE